MRRSLSASRTLVNKLPRNKTPHTKFSRKDAKAQRKSALMVDFYSSTRNKLRALQIPEAFHKISVIAVCGGAHHESPHDSVCFTSLAFSLCCSSPTSALRSRVTKSRQRKCSTFCTRPSRPAASVSPTRDNIILSTGLRYPPLADLAQPMLRLAGRRINPAANSPHRYQYSVGLTLKRIADGSEVKIEVPPNAKISGVEWSDDGKHFAFLNGDAKSSGTLGRRRSDRQNPQLKRRDRQFSHGQRLELDARQPHAAGPTRAAHARRRACHTARAERAEHTGKFRQAWTSKNV